MISTRWKNGELCKNEIHQNATIANGNQRSSAEAADFVASLKACAKHKDLRRGTRVHADLLETGLLGSNRYVASTLVSMYSKCGALATAQQVLDELSIRDVVSWSALIAGYAKHGHGEKALACFERMQREGLSPNAVTFTCILKACSSIGAANMGEKVHSEIVRQGLLEKDLMLGNALVNMYAKCGALSKAQQVLDELPVRDVISWSALIAGYAQYGHGKEALICFERMQGEGLCPNEVTFSCILKACGSTGASDKGEKVHAEIVRQGFLGKDIVLDNALVDMYSKCGAFAKAQQVLDELPLRDIITWNALITGYAQHGLGEEALNCFDRMQREGFSPNAVTFTCILKVCGSLRSLNKGEKIHIEIVRKQLLGKFTELGNALIDMYAKCGVLGKARQVLDELRVRNVISWSVLIAGYAQHGHGEDAITCFERMQLEGILPDAVTFCCVLNACSHSGLLDQGERYFVNMSTKHDIIPDLEHHASLVDLFGRAGHFHKAVAVIKKMPSSDCLSVWVALLGACHKWGNMDLGRFAFEHAVQLDKKHAAAYVCMRNMYVAAGMKENAERIEAMRLTNKA